MQRGEYGPADIQETLNDAVDVALRDQEDAGIDIVSDGEMRRLGFFTADFYNRLSGLRTQPPDRRLGPAGHDQREHYEAVDRLAAPDGLGLVPEYQYVRTRTAKPIKMPCPGPLRWRAASRRAAPTTTAWTWLTRWPRSSTPN